MGAFPFESFTKNQQHMEFYQTKIRPWIGVAALVFLGIMMIADPDAMTDAEGTGRRALYRVVFKAVWGVPAGVACLLAASALGSFQLRKNPGEEEED